MTESIKARFEKSEKTGLTWDPVKGGKWAFVCFDDDRQYDLGPDPDRHRFEEIAERMTTGRYYPPDAVRFYGRFEEEGRPLRAGDRILQQAPLFGFLYCWSMAELFVVERTADRCHIGYVTTAAHHGRGIWQADLRWSEGRLTLRVTSTASPHSWLFWLGLPVARYLQLRARRRAVEVFRSIHFLGL